MSHSTLGGRAGFRIEDRRDGRDIDRSDVESARFDILIGRFRVVDDGSDTCS